MHLLEHGRGARPRAPGGDELLRRPDGRSTIGPPAGASSATTGDRCAALDVSAPGRFPCRIYDVRPDDCRIVEPGSPGVPRGAPAGPPGLERRVRPRLLSRTRRICRSRDDGARELAGDVGLDERRVAADGACRRRRRPASRRARTAASRITKSMSRPRRPRRRGASRRSPRAEEILDAAELADVRVLLEVDEHGRRRRRALAVSAAARSPAARAARRGAREPRARFASSSSGASGRAERRVEAPREVLRDADGGERVAGGRGHGAVKGVADSVEHAGPQGTSNRRRRVKGPARRAGGIETSCYPHRHVRRRRGRLRDAPRRDPGRGPREARAPAARPPGRRRSAARERLGPVLNFCANNYLGPELPPARRSRPRTRALDAYGYGLSSVRFICGTQDAHKGLEAAARGVPRHGGRDPLLVVLRRERRPLRDAARRGRRDHQRRAQPRVDHRRHPPLQGRAPPLRARRHGRARGGAAEDRRASACA